MGDLRINVFSRYDMYYARDGAEEVKTRNSRGRNWTRSQHGGGLRTTGASCRPGTRLQARTPLRDRQLCSRWSRSRPPFLPRRTWGAAASFPFSAVLSPPFATAGPGPLLPRAPPPLLISNIRSAAVQVMSPFLSDTSAFISTITGFTTLGK